MKISTDFIIKKGLTKAEYDMLVRNAARNTSPKQLRKDMDLAREYNLPGLSKILDDALYIQIKKWSRELSARLDALDN